VTPSGGSARSVESWRRPSHRGKRYHPKRVVSPARVPSWPSTGSSSKPPPDTRRPRVCRKRTSRRPSTASGRRGSGSRPAIYFAQIRVAYLARRLPGRRPPPRLGAAEFSPLSSAARASVLSGLGRPRRNAPATPFHFTPCDYQQRNPPGWYPLQAARRVTVRRRVHGYPLDRSSRVRGGVSGRPKTKPAVR
jgi:hypothetical protein